MKKTKLTTHASRLLMLSLAFIMLAASLCGCTSDPKNFTEGKLTITLTKQFKVESNSSFDVYIASDNVVFSAVEEDKSSIEYSGYEINSLNDYCSEILALNGMGDKKEVVTRNNYRYFTNTATVSGANYTYVHCMFETGSSYWVCEFVCKTKSYDNLKKTIFEWADTIRFSE